MSEAIEKNSSQVSVKETQPQATKTGQSKEMTPAQLEAVKSGSDAHLIEAVNVSTGSNNRASQEGLSSLSEDKTQSQVFKAGQSTEMTTVQLEAAKTGSDAYLAGAMNALSGFTSDLSDEETSLVDLSSEVKEEETPKKAQKGYEFIDKDFDGQMREKLSSKEDSSTSMVLGGSDLGDDDVQDDNSDTEETTSSNPFSMGGLIGGSVVGFIIDSTVEQQKFLLEISGNYLDLFGSSVEASTTAANSEYNLGISAASKQKAATMSEANQLMTSGICSSLTVGGLVATPLSMKQGYGSMKQAQNDMTESDKVGAQYEKPTDLDKLKESPTGGHRPEGYPKPMVKIGVKDRHNGTKKEAYEAGHDNPAAPGAPGKLTKEQADSINAQYDKEVAGVNHIRNNTDTFKPGAKPRDYRDSLPNAGETLDGKEITAYDRERIPQLYQEEKINAIKNDYRTQGKISKETQEKYGILRPESKSSNIRTWLTGRGSRKSIKVEQDDEAKIALKEIHEENSRGATPKEVQEKHLEFKKTLQNNKAEARSRFQEGVSDQQWYTTLYNTLSQSVQSTTNSVLKRAQAEDQNDSQRFTAASGLYRTSSSNLSQIGQTYSSGSSTLVNQANSQLSGVMDAARRASARS